MKIKAGVMNFDQLWTKTQRELPGYIPKAAVQGLHLQMVTTWNAALDYAAEKFWQQPESEHLISADRILTLKVNNP